MQSRAVGRYCRVSPRRTKLVLEAIKGMSAEEASYFLRHCKTRSAVGYIEKVLKSAIANAEQKAEKEKIDIDSLYVKEVVVGQGPTLKRIKPRAMGRATRINKKMSHITIILDDNVEKKK